MKTRRSATALAVANVVAKARDEAGLSQRDLAALLDRPHSVVGMIETAQRQVTVPELVTIADAIGVDPLELLGRALREVPDRIALKRLAASRRRQLLGKKDSLS